MHDSEGAKDDERVIVSVRGAEIIQIDLGRDINAYYTSKDVPQQANRKLRKKEREAQRHLAALNNSVVTGQ